MPKIGTISHPKFSAHKNGTDQTGIVTGTWTKITFGTEVYDVGAAYDAANSKWIPGVIGQAHISASTVFTVPVDQQQMQVAVYINGVIHKRTFFVASGTESAGPVIGIDIPITAAADYIEIYALHNFGINKDIYGIATITFFMGHMLP